MKSYLKTIVATALVSLTLSGAVWAAPSERRFSTPDQAVKALARAVQNRDRAEFLSILGPGLERFAATDPAERALVLKKLSALFGEGWSLSTTQDQHRVIRLGEEGWGFPVPLVKTGSSWSFDAALGADEISNRRLGRNELAAIETCHLLVKAEAAFKASGNSKFTDKLISSTGNKDGLYWPATGDEESPLAQVLGPSAELVASRAKGTPWFGYYFVLALPSDDSFVLRAWPVKYGDTGVMSFWVDESGVVYEKDLGPDSGSVLRSLDLTKHEDWEQVQEEN
jgi:Protein of unknown function (DUF2950)